ncbi:SRPBCC family protein [Arthrobacter sp. 3Tela_A]|uniref:SRPBCC family protein n=1 Tax=Arthrobacter sp. 3Tela_A TaxID=3093743 RepID=UPI003BB7E36E
MDIDSTFTVDAPPAEVWEAVMDFESVAGCIPGAQILNKLNDDAYQVGMKVKLGPVSLQYRGQLDVLERDTAARRAVLQGSAKEVRGQGTAQATVILKLEEAGGGTQGLVSADIGLSGKAAAMGKGVIGSVTEQMMAVFAENLQAMVNARSAGSGPAGDAQSVPVPETVSGAAQTPVPGGPHTGGFSGAAGSGTSEPDRTDLPATHPGPAGRTVGAGTAGLGAVGVKDREETPASPSLPLSGIQPPKPAAEVQGLDGLALMRGVVGEQLRQPAVQLWLYSAVAFAAYHLGRRAARRSA